MIFNDGSFKKFLNNFLAFVLFLTNTKILHFFVIFLFKASNVKTKYEGIIPVAPVIKIDFPLNFFHGIGEFNMVLISSVIILFILVFYFLT